MKPGAARVLVLHGGAAYRRLAGIVAGVALGVGMLLILLGAFLHMPDRDARAAWIDPKGEWLEYTEEGEVIVPTATSTAILAQSSQDYFDGLTIAVMRMATSADTDVMLPTGLVPPAPGEYYASPAMIDVIDAAPADQLGQRYGERLGELPAEMLKGPSQRAILVGAGWDAVANRAGAVMLEDFPSETRYSASTTYQVILAIGAIAILVPIVLLISIVGQLGAAERRDRFATVRLIGAGRRAVAWLSAWEMAAASAVGAVIGIGVAAAVTPLATRLTLNGATTYAADLSPSLAWTAAMVVGVTALGAATAWWRAFSDDVGAPGATRERAEKQVTAWRALTLGLGIVLMVGAAWMASSGTGPVDLASYGFILGFALIAFGIVIAGPWLTRVASAALRRFASRASAVVAAGRLERHPRSTFRSVAGLVVAVFIVSVFAGSASAIQGLIEPKDRPGLLDPHAVAASAGPGVDAEAARAVVGSIEGVEHVTIGYWPEDPDAGGALMSVDDARAIGATDLPSSDGAIIDVFGMLADNGEGSGISIDPPREASTAVGGDVSYVIAVTDGETASIERTRTALFGAANPDLAPLTRADFANAGTAEVTNELAIMAYLGMGIAIGISALSLAVATAAAALDRKRTFGLLRLAGMPVRQLRSTVSIEATVPLAATLLASAGLGFGVAWLMIEALGNGLSVDWPDPRYWGAIAAALVIAAVSVTASFGSVRRSTELESTRFE